MLECFAVYVFQTKYSVMLLSLEQFYSRLLFAQAVLSSYLGPLWYRTLRDLKPVCNGDLYIHI